MLIMSRVCAEFHDRRGNIIYTIGPETMMTFQEVPEAIQEDPLFQLLVEDGSLEASLTPAQRRTLEQNPMAGATPDGRKLTATGASGSSSASGSTAGKKKTASAKAEAAKSDVSTSSEAPASEEANPAASDPA